jgi:sugar phosphate permease
LIISKWYLPSETQTRIATFYSASALAGAFSGLLAAGIAKMDGVSGLEGWRWIFLLEGIMTVIAGVVCFFCLIDSPALSTRWLDQDEIRYLELRQIADPSRRTAREAKSQGFDKAVLWAVLTDWQIYFQALIYWSNTIPNNGLKFTMPKIITNMGFSSTAAQLLTVPPYICGAISAFGSALFADRYTWRMPFIVVPQLLVVIAYSILFAKSADIKNNIGVCYFAVVLACIGLYPINPGGNAWTINNLAGPTKRAMGIAYMVSLGNIGGVVGSYIYKDNEAPTYPTGFGSSLAFAAAGAASCLILDVTYKMTNSRRDKLSLEEIKRKHSEEELVAMGDQSPLFRYSL